MRLEEGCKFCTTNSSESVPFACSYLIRFYLLSIRSLKMTGKVHVKCSVAS